MIWIILVAVIGIAAYSFSSGNGHHDTHGNADEGHTYFDDISDEEVEYDYLQREQEKRDEEDRYIQQLHEEQDN